MENKVYSVPFYLRPSDPGTARGKAMLELAAKKRLKTDLEEDGYTMAETSFVVHWNADGRSGLARATGFRETQ